MKHGGSRQTVPESRDQLDFDLESDYPPLPQALRSSLISHLHSHPQHPNTATSHPFLDRLSRVAPLPSKDNLKPAGLVGLSCKPCSLGKSLTGRWPAIGTWEMNGDEKDLCGTSIARVVPATRQRANA